MLSVVLMGQAGQISDKPAPPYEDKVRASWARLYERAQTLWEGYQIMRTRVGGIIVGEQPCSHREIIVLRRVGRRDWH